jgi:hypothetical protein
VYESNLKAEMCLFMRKDLPRPQEKSGVAQNHLKFVRKHFSRERLVLTQIVATMQYASKTKAFPNLTT